MTSKKTSTFTDINCSNNEKRTISSNSQPSPKQVRFGCEEQIYSYPNLTTIIRQLRTGTTTTISNDETHNTLI